MRIPKCRWPKTREIVALALASSKVKNKEALADLPYPDLLPRDKSSLLLVATVDPPPSIDYDPAQPTGRIGKDVELLECQGAEASIATLKGMLNECMKQRSIPDLKRVHNHVVTTHRCGKRLGTLLVRAYGECGEPDTAVHVFNGLIRRDTGTWNAAMHAMGFNGRHRDAFNIFRLMILDGTPLEVSSFVQVLKCCGEMGGLGEAKLVYSCVRCSTWYSDVDVLNQLIETLEKVGAVDEAGEVFRVANRVGNMRTWSAMVQAMVKRGEFGEALRMFLKLRSVKDKKLCGAALEACTCVGETRAVHERVRKCGLEKDVDLSTMLFRLYVHFGSFEDARMVFDVVEKKDVEWWETMADTYAMSGDARNVLGLYRCMSLNGIKYCQKLQAEILETCVAVAERRAQEQEAAPAIAV